jgi:hypothetical protein
MTVRQLTLFAACIAGAAFLHELGHAAAAWAHGIPAIPTLMKEYVAGEVRWDQYQWISLGGVAVSLSIALVASAWYATGERATGDVVLAGALVMPFAYTLRFALAGRGHDGFEWQAAQAALGASATGHLVDILFLLTTITGATVWLTRRDAKRTLRSAARAVGLQLAGILMLVALQVGNNLAFDRFFPSSTQRDVPAEVRASRR